MLNFDSRMSVGQSAPMAHFISTDYNGPAPTLWPAPERHIHTRRGLFAHGSLAEQLEDNLMMLNELLEPRRGYR